MQGRSDLFEIVLQKVDTLNKKTIEENILKEYLIKSDNIRFWAFILHDKDIDNNGAVKTPHYHIVVKFYSPYGKNTIINAFAKDLMINKNIIGVQIVRSLVSITRYLSHSDSPEKYRYNELHVCSSNNEEYLEIYNGTDIFTLDMQSLLNVLEKCDTLAQVYCAIGLKNSVKYRGVINDLWRDYQVKKAHAIDNIIGMQKGVNKMATFMNIVRFITLGCFAFSGVVLLVGYIMRKRKIKKAEKEIKEENKNENKQKGVIL